MLATALEIIKIKILKINLKRYIFVPLFLLYILKLDMAKI